MAHITTSLGKRIQIKQNIEEILERLDSEFIYLTEVSYGEKMNGETVRHENNLFIRSQNIIIIEP